MFSAGTRRRAAQDGACRRVGGWWRTTMLRFARKRGRKASRARPSLAPTQASLEKDGMHGETCGGAGATAGWGVCVCGGGGGETLWGVATGSAHSGALGSPGGHARRGPAVHTPLRKQKRRQSWARTSPPKRQQQPRHWQQRAGGARGCPWRRWRRLRVGGSRGWNFTEPKEFHLRRRSRSRA
jgi:hypothetical protein